MLDDDFVIQERGSVELKGKGRMTTYWLVGRRNGDGLRVPPT